MISRRLTKNQKDEILEAYRAGFNSNVLAEKYSCTTNTINRTVKTLLSESEYASLKEKRSKIIKKKGEVVQNEILKNKQQDLEKSNSLISLEFKGKEEDESLKIVENIDNPEIKKLTSLPIEDATEFCEESFSESKNFKNDNMNQNFDNNFEEIAPLISNFEFDQDKQKSNFEILNYESLPESVYMIVDKKVELDLQPISDLPEWSFLPENELRRNAILLFSNQRSAKRSCEKNQRVIKIPNTAIFKLSKSYLVSKGITRLILEDSIIALDN
tara:strand:- start:1473 stop:2288 length:816 start_codon:yes stop_codon:yes gene_type:complete